MTQDASIDGVSRVEEQLREENQYLRAVIDALGYPLYVINAETQRVEMVNELAYQGELAGDQTCHELIHGRERPCEEAGYPCLLQQIKHTKMPTVVQHVEACQDGSSRYSEVHGFPIFDQDGKVVRIVEFSLDVSERVKTEQAEHALTHALGERVKELNCLYSISKLGVEPGISIPTLLQRSVELLPAGWQYPEITCARIILEEHDPVQSEHFQESPWKQAAEIISGGKSIGKLEVYYQQEKPQYFEGPFLEEERHLIDAVAEWLGITLERMQIDQALRESEIRWRSLTETSPDHILTLDTDLNITFANYASPGLTVAELIGTPLYTYVDPDRQAEIKGILESVLKSGEPASYETVYHLPDGGNIYYESRVTPHLSDDENRVWGLTISARDITARKRVEEQRRQLAALEERERIGRELHDDLGQVIAFIHMQAQTGLIQLDKQNLNEVQAALDELVKISQSTYTDIRQYILGIRRGLQPSSVNFFDQLRGLLESQKVRYELETQLSVIGDWQENPFSPEVERQLLGIIQEALNNICKHAGVTQARLILRQQDDQASIVIEDDGIGFSIDPLMEFSTTEEDPHFGLSIMRERAERVAGRLEIRSTPGEGTQIIVWMPLS